MGNLNWEFINSFAPWFSAIGTLLAVIVALYFSQKDSTIKLRVSANIKILVIPNLKHQKDYLTLSITNLRSRPATITAIGWEIGLLRHKSFWQKLDVDESISSQLPPNTLQDGEQADYYLPLEEWLNTNSGLFNESLSTFAPSISAYFIRVVIATSTGKKFTSKIKSNFRKVIVENLTHNKYYIKF